MHRPGHSSPFILLPSLSRSPCHSPPNRWKHTPAFFFLAPDAKHDLQAWVIIYHYSFSVSSALKVNRNASMLTDLLSKIFVPRFRSYDWCLSEFQVYALWKARWLDLQPPTPAPYITLVSDLQRPKMREMYSTHVRLLWTVGPVYRPAKLRHWKLNPGPYLIKERQMRSNPMIRPYFFFKNHKLALYWHFGLV